ncbi:GNAT family N-acetyltransferase [uncultured Rothia sp.]|uniref:GNAT family N-acetyltransferase n=1 Tax=uncultured Rothia sp. TaxID=316088 RepID=UPI003217BB6B
MGFVCKGRFVLEPAGADDAEKYVDLLHNCMEETYAPIADPGFMLRRRAGRNESIEEFAEEISHPGVRCFLAYEVPGWTSEGGLSCTVSAEIDWEKPVGLALSVLGPQEWESEMPVKPVAPGTRDLDQLYTRASTHGTGLGVALMRAVLPDEEPAYLWYIRGNERAKRFYEKHGFTDEGIFGECGGSWAVPDDEPGEALWTGRMFRGIEV